MLFIPIKFKTYVQLTPAELDSKYQDKIFEKLRTTYEGTCTKFGYIKPDSLEIVRRSCGNLIKQNFNGAIRFDVICRGEVCNPIQGSVVSAIIKNKNQLGILAESTMEYKNARVPILDIIIPTKSAGIISEVNLDTLTIGDTIDVEVMGKKYQMKDKKISIIGRVIILNDAENLEENEEEEEDEEGSEENFDEVLSDDDDEEEVDDETGKPKTVSINDEEEEEEDEEDEEEENEFEGGDDLYEENDDADDVDDFDGDDVAFGGGVDEY